jgi:hypothetical protein
MQVWQAEITLARKVREAVGNQLRRCHIEPVNRALHGEIMRQLFVAALAFGAVALSSGAALASDPGLPWCIVYSYDDYPVCEARTYAECMATASGNVGYCTPNPAYFSSNEQAWGQAFSNPYGPPPPPPRSPSRRRGY